MILKITKNTSDGIAGDNTNYEITPELLKLSGVHAFLKSKKWDEIDIELTEDIPLGSLKYLHTLTDNIKVSFEDTRSKYIMMLCAELFPDKSGTIRKQFLQRGEVPSELLC